MGPPSEAPSYLGGAVLDDASLKRAVFDRDTKLPFGRDEALRRGMAFGG